jgi:4-hydroxyphenylpyruvate dioxygenase
MELRLPAIKGIGGAPLYLIDRFEDGKSIYDIDFEFIDGVDRTRKGHGLRLIDHLTHNVYRGRMAYWGGFYERCSISARSATSTSRANTPASPVRAMTAPDGLIRIPLNEESARARGRSRSS